MHKKLFGLLATAAVGLTLTSCGGGGGGGGGSSDTPTDTEDTPVVEEGAPASIEGKTIQVNVGKNGTVETYTFMANNHVDNMWTRPGEASKQYIGTYEYTVGFGGYATLKLKMPDSADSTVRLYFENGKYVSFEALSGYALLWNPGELYMN